MGSEIGTSHFSPDDFKEFSRRLEEETRLLSEWFQESAFDPEGGVTGYELECWLVDGRFRPAPFNEPFLDCLKSPRVVPELSLFNAEVNSLPHFIRADLFSDLQKELDGIWNSCRACAASLKAHVAMIGILPTIEEGELVLRNMSPLKRFRALNEQCLRLRGGKPFHLDIQGAEHLKTTHHDVMLEAATTSLQIHLQVSLKNAVRFFNSALLISAPMVAVAANSPFLFGKDLWDETRIPLFEQAVAVGGERRVTFGSGYAQNSLFEFFERNLKKYPVILPIHFQEGEDDLLPHLRLHNGTIWRWNRPLVGRGPRDRPHLRIEHRVAAAGPSPVDVIANIVFFLGLIHYYGSAVSPLDAEIPFQTAQQNFYRAAKEGLQAEIVWRGGKKFSLRSLLLEEFIPAALEGLKGLGIDGAAIDHYLRSIVENRVKSGQNGAAWQRRFVARYGKDFQALTKTYLENQESGKPVHVWSV